MILSKYTEARAARRADRRSSPPPEAVRAWPQSVAARAVTALAPDFDGRSEPMGFLTLVYARDADGGAR